MKFIKIIFIILSTGIVFLALILFHQGQGKTDYNNHQKRFQMPSKERKIVQTKDFNLPSQVITDKKKGMNIRALIKHTSKKKEPVNPDSFIEAQKKHRDTAAMLLWARRSIKENWREQNDEFVLALCSYENALENQEFKFMDSVLKKEPKAILQSKRILALILMNLGKNYERICKYEFSEMYLQRALELCRETGDQSVEAAVLTNLGVLYARKGMVLSGLDYFKKSMDLDSVSGHPESDICNQINMANAYALMKQDSLANVYRVSARSSLEEGSIEHKELYQKILANNEALSFYFNGEITSALAFIQSIQTSIGKKTPYKKPYEDYVVLFNQAEIMSSLGQYEKANQLFSTVLKFIGHKNRLNHSCSHYRQFIAETSDKEALRRLPDDFYIYDCELYWRVQRGLATGLLYTSANPTDIVRHNQSALIAINHIRFSMDSMQDRAEFMRDKKWMMDEMMGVYVGLHLKNPGKGFDKLAWDVFEQKQGREFLDKVGQSGARHFSRKPHILIEYEKKYTSLVKNEIVLIGSEDRAKKTLVRGHIRNHNSRRLQHKTHMMQNFPEYTDLINPSAISYGEIQSELMQPDEAIVIYQLTPSSIFTWVISKNDFYFHTEAMNEESLSRRVDAFRRYASGQIIDALQSGINSEGFSEVINYSFIKFAKASSELYNILFPEPVHRSLIDKKTLFIVPTGCLQDLPFEALISGATPNDLPHYLLYDYAVSYLSSASMLKVIYGSKRKRDLENRPEQRELLAFANPVFPSAPSLKERNSKTISWKYRSLMGGDFQELPETEEEVRMISSTMKHVVPRGIHDLYLREKATKDQVIDLDKNGTLNSYKYMVFATHALIPGDDDHVLQPAIVLSDSTSGPFLTLNDILKLDLNADMVVLSACNTGRGKRINGEGTFSLSRAFMYAGASTAAVNLWAVESLSAKQISTGMFNHLSSFQTPVNALHLSKIEYLEDAVSHGNIQHLHPFFWSPMILYGNLNFFNVSMDQESFKKPAKKPSGHLHRIIWDGHRFLVVGHWDTLLTSRDGTIWYSETPGMGSNHILQNIIHANNTYLLTEISNLGGYESLYSSTNLYQWTFLMEKCSKGYPVWMNGEYLMVSEYGDIWRSKDLKVWTENKIPIGKGIIRDAVFAGNPGQERLVCVGTEIYTSLDGSEWHTVFSPKEKEQFRQVIWNGYQFLAVGKKHFLTSQDGIFWVPWENHIGHKPVAWKGDVYVMVLRKQSAISHDGIHWDLSDLNNNNTQGNVNDIQCSEDTCVAVGDYGLLIYSHDGLTWNPVPLKK